MHHAWLLAGPEGSGKAAFASQAAAELVGAPDAPSSGTHPDILHLQREPKDAAEVKKAEEGKPFALARNIAIDQIRAMQRALTTRPTMGLRRAVIIDPANDLETSAANALLKSLEEPPSGTFFLLVAHYPARLLPTIRSRCRVVRFRPTDGLVGADQESEEEESRELGLAIGALIGTGADYGPHLAKLAAALGGKPSRDRQRTTIRLAQQLLIGNTEGASPLRFALVDRTYTELCRLDAELAVYNYDSDLLVARIATLLSAVPASIDARDG